MDPDLFSSSLSLYTEEIENPALRDSISNILEFLDIGTPKFYKWSETKIAVAITVDVDLPSLGNYEDIDIQANEPILIVFDTAEYPTTPPIVFTDRLSFPKNNLAHLYIAVNGRPPAFCLTRGSFADWYAGKRSVDLVIRIGNWLRDAATGKLSLDGGQFDPMRLEKYSGIVVYDYDRFLKIVHERKSFVPNQNFAILLFKRNSDTSFKFILTITAENYEEVAEILQEASEKENASLKTDHFHVGYLVWSNDKASNGQFIIDTPIVWNELKNFAQTYGISFNFLESYIATDDKNHFMGIPIIIAIKRPLNVIGYPGNIEFSNYTAIINNTDKVAGKINSDAAVSLFSHNQPLTLQKANNISGLKQIFEETSMIMGCGALGSKITMHLARGGNGKLILVDPDTISPHNLVRHALLGQYIGLNKALAVKEAIESIYPDQKTEVVNKVLTDPTLQHCDYNKLGWIFDFTASENVFNTIINARKLTAPVICRANISDSGNLGILNIEGFERNPRLDDLQVSLFSRYSHSQSISDWLHREYASLNGNTVNVNIGVGCNSETTILSDEVISSHGAYFAGVIKHEASKTRSVGKIYLNRVISSGEYQMESEVIEVKPFVVIPAVNEPSWLIRFAHGVTDKIILQTSKAGHFETGGVFIGVANYKTKTIHVTGVIDAPVDSTANEVCFFRGHKGLASEIDKVTIGSGNQLGYIGEWHSHPRGPDALSPTDLKAVSNFKKDFEQLTTPLPVFLTIVTPHGILPFIY
jgi:hypothetical protein